MSYSCGPHGWRHLLNPCPSCYQTSTRADTFANPFGLSQEEKVRDLQAKLAESESQAAAMERVLYRIGNCDLIIDGNYASIARDVLRDKTAGVSLLKRLREQEEVIGVYEEALRHYSDRSQFEDRGLGVTDETVAREALVKAKEIRK